jgi:hypothetical protein
MIPTREDWCKPGKITNPNVDIWFMGWSVFMDQGITIGESTPMGSLFTVFQAQVMAILR